jgi:hypothetical protein
MKNKDLWRVADGDRAGQASPGAATASPPSGDHPSRVIHMRNGRAQRHRHTMGAGETWCGKKLLGQPDCDGEGIETFSSYGSEVRTTYDEPFVTCQRCLDAFDTSYRRAFPDGPKPIATFRTDDPADMERAKALLSPEALNGFFGPGGGGMAAFDAALRDSDTRRMAETGTGSERSSGSAGRESGIAPPEDQPNGEHHG